MTEMVEEDFHEQTIYSSVDDVRAALNLRPAEEWQELSIRSGYYPRRSGRTTEMVLQATLRLVTEPDSKVVVVGNSREHSISLSYQLKSLIRWLGYRDNSVINVHLSNVRSYDQLRGIKNLYIYEDHSRFNTDTYREWQFTPTPNVDIRLSTSFLNGGTARVDHIHIEWDRGKPKPNKPEACEGCSNYHGEVYGGNLLVCAMHPYGVKEEECADHSAWEGKIVVQQRDRLNLRALD